MSPLPQKGRIAIVADVPSASSWVDAKPSPKGSYMKTFKQQDALVIEYKPRQGIYSQITLPNADGVSLAVTWPKLSSADWPISRSYSASLTTVQIKNNGTVLSKHRYDAGANQHLIWNMNSTGDLFVNFVENSGVSHVLQAYVSVEGSSIRFARQCSEQRFLSENPGYCKARFAFRPLTASANPAPRRAIRANVRQFSTETTRK